MPHAIVSLVELKQYLDGVMKKAHHHSPNVCDIIPTIMGNVMIYADIDQIEVGVREGDMKNEMWIMVSEYRYYLCYNHDDGTIDLKEDGRQGMVLAKFDNSSPIYMVKATFEKLWREAVPA
jgi:hypothetical protein